MKVLIIDDDKSICLYVQAYFDEAGHDATIAESGEVALQLFDEQDFDLIISDIIMPGLDGFQTVELIRKKANEWLPVIFMTSSREDKYLQKGIDAGGGFYLPKPLKPLSLKSYMKVMESLIEMRKKLSYNAKFDELTGLPNRTFFKDRLDISIKRAKRNNSKIGLLFIDLDNFKNINDLMGHSAGDEVLKEAAARLQQSVRESDTVCRIGGDEFIVMLSDLKNVFIIDKVANNILNKLSLPFIYGNKEAPLISGSVGVSVYPDDATNIDNLLKTSDTAMYKAKKEGRNNCIHYNKKLGNEIYEHTLIQNELKHAIEKNQFELYYQPQLTCGTYQLSGMEALLRWNHPEFGMVPPDKFIPIAEESALISSIGIWVLKTVCKQMNEWKNLGYEVPRISINVSVRQLKDKHLEEDIINIIKESNLSFDSLTLEVTESCIMDQPEKMIKTLSRLKNLGFKISIDDFGTGYSSMTYLTRLPLDQLKIDREFIKSIPNEIDKCAITNAILTLGQTLGLNVIAEGVETPEQFKFLKNENCNEIQGYLFCKPLPAKEISSMLEYIEKKYVVNG